MKTLILTSLAALTVGACATDSANVAPPPAGLVDSAAPYQGWLRVGGGEFRLYETQMDARRGGTSCVSGALPRDAQAVAGDMNNSMVRIFGRTAAWAERGAGPVYDWQGAKIINDCRRDTVILADRIEVIR